MTTKAKGSHVFQPAFAATFDDRRNMVGRPGTDEGLEPGKLEPKHIKGAIPVRLALYFSWKLRRLEPRLLQQGFEDPQKLIAIGSTERTDSKIALKYLFSKIPWIASKFVLMDASLRTKGSTAFRNLTPTPSAERAAVRPPGKLLMIFPAGFRPDSVFAHRDSSNT